MVTEVIVIQKSRSPYLFLYIYDTTGTYETWLGDLTIRVVYRYLKQRLKNKVQVWENVLDDLSKVTQDNNCGTS